MRTLNTIGYDPTKSIEVQPGVRRDPRPPRDPAAVCDYFAWLSYLEDEGAFSHKEMQALLDNPDGFFSDGGKGWISRNILDDIKNEREAQDARWGGPDHDDEHTPDKWHEFIIKHINRARGAEMHHPTFRQRMVKVAALAIAAIESADRKTERRNVLLACVTPEEFTDKWREMG